MWAFALALLPASATADCSLGASTCYVDDDKRILGADHFAGAMSREYCSQHCSDKGFALAGVENGEECFCGNVLRADAKKASAGDCHHACKYGPAGEKCGGYWRLDVYNFSCSGTPVPQPRAPDYINNPCLNKTSPFAGQPWCDPTLPMDERVADMVGRLTLAEKIAALNTQTTPLPSLGLNGYNWWSEATHGISHGAQRRDHSVRNQLRLPDHHGHGLQPNAVVAHRPPDRTGGARLHERGQRVVDVLGAGHQPGARAAVGPEH